MTCKKNTKQAIFFFILLAISLVVYAGPEEGKLKPVILVLPFENSTGLLKYEPMEKGIRDLLMADLSQQEEITVVDRDKMKAITEELSLKSSGLLDERHILEIGRLTGANLVLNGGFIIEKDQLVVDAHIYDIATTQLITSERAEGEIGDIVAIEEELMKKEKMKKIDIIFFFKQKTAYEIYQCDWSSDVCSSDLSYCEIAEYYGLHLPAVGQVIRGRMPQYEN